MKDLAETHRQVEKDELERLGKEYNSMALETSAASDCVGVVMAFNYFLEYTRQYLKTAKRFVEKNNEDEQKRKNSLVNLHSLYKMFANRRYKQRKLWTL